ncbi:hypothetical protein BH09SUM1_BH09SUM1_16680 [soil metagenome]
MGQALRQSMVGEEYGIATSAPSAQISPMFLRAPLRVLRASVVILLFSIPPIPATPAAPPPPKSAADEKLWTSREKGSQSYLTLSPLFVDSESHLLASDEYISRPGAYTDFYVDDQLYFRYTIIGYYNGDTNYAPGTFYVYRIGSDLMDGETMGYNHIGNGSFFRPTVLVRASQTPELKWIKVVNDGSFNDLAIATLNFIVDARDRPSISLSNSRTGDVFAAYRYNVFVEFGEDNSRMGTQSYRFPVGGATTLAAIAWGEPFQTAQGQVILDSNIPVGPLRVTYGVDDYTSATLNYIGEARKYYDSGAVFTSVRGYSATEYLDALGYTPSPPPAWIVRMALERKLRGKTKWLYWPLDRYADVNGDGVLDAADLLTLNQPPPSKAESAHVP